MDIVVLGAGVVGAETQY